MVAYELKTFNLKTGVISGNALPLASLSFRHTLNEAGSASAVVPLIHADVTTARLTPGMTGTLIIRDGQPVWIGYLNAARGSLSDDTLSLDMVGVHAHYAGVHLLMSFDEYFGRIGDQGEFFQRWYSYANSNNGIGTDYSNVALTGTLVIRGWHASQFKSLSTAVEELCEDAPGLIFRYEPYWAGADRTRIYHRIVVNKRAAGGLYLTALVHGQNCEVSGVSYDGSVMATNAYAIGGQIEGETFPPFEGVRNDPLAALMPARDVVATYKEVTESAGLTAKAQSMLTLGSKPLAIPALTLNDGTRSPALFPPGINAVVNVKRGYVSLNELMTVTETSVAVDSNGRETISLALVNREAFVSA